MHLQFCLALPGPQQGTDQSQCREKIASPSPFCLTHESEYRTFLVRRASSEREVERLWEVVEGIVSDGIASYKSVKDMDKDAAVVKVHLEVIEDAVKVKDVLRERFFVEGRYPIEARV